jgi:hypothetical protein
MLWTAPITGIAERQSAEVVEDRLESGCGYFPTFKVTMAMSALPPETDIDDTMPDVSS